jgi:ferredoxin
MRLFYFTGTGNSLAAARRLAGHFPGATVEPMPSFPAGAGRVEADAVGLVYPTHVWGTPPLVLRFARKTDFATPYLFAVTTVGGAHGESLAMLERTLARRDVPLAYGAGVIMVDNYIPMFDIAPPEKRQARLERATVRLDAVAADIAARRRGVERSSWIWHLLGRWTWPSWARNLPRSDEAFYVNDGCTSCGLCRRVCPVGNIELDGGRPVWRHACEMCLACIHLCPTRVIQRSRRTESHGRYRHPEVTPADLEASRR